MRTAWATKAVVPW